MTSPMPPSELQQLLNVITGWNTEDLITLAEAKMQLRIDPSDLSKDPEIEFLITGISVEIANLANRVFGYEKVDEEFFNVVDEERLYFTRWPVQFADIQTLTYNGVDILPDYKSGWFLNQKKGYLYRPNDAWTGTLDAVYTGGYKIPAETPADLKRATSIALREDYYAYLRGATMSGIRMISHKHARVMYYPPGQVAATGRGGGAAMGPVWSSVMAVIDGYIRHWV